MRFFYLILLLGCIGDVFGQVGLRSLDKGALRHYRLGVRLQRMRDFDKAIVHWEKALARDSGFVNAHWALARVYEILLEKDKALYHQETALLVAPYYRDNRRLHGEVAHKYYVRGEYEKAWMRLGYQKQILHSKDYSDLTARISFARAARATPHAVSPTRLSGPLNNFSAQYFGSFPLDEKQLFFTVRKAPTSDEDFYMSTRRTNNENWDVPVPLEALNTPYNEGTGSVSADGRWLVFSTCQRPDSKGSCDIYLSRLDAQGRWGLAEPLKGGVNTEHWESQPCVSADGRRLYFSSDRPGGFGQRDLWMSIRRSTHEWSIPVNLGPAINTSGDELSPFIHASSQSLYFASNGHPGLGGWDLWVTHQASKTNAKGIDSIYWTKPLNLGYPINDHKDQLAMHVNAGGEWGYYTYEYINEAKQRVSDLYKVALPASLRPTPAFVLRGRIRNPSGETLSANVRLYRIGQIQPEFAQRKTPKGHFVVPIPQQLSYLLHVTHPDYLPYSRTFSTQNANPTDSLIITLQPIQTGLKTTLPHIYFEVDAYDLSPQSQTGLKTAWDFLRTHQNIQVEIEGHTDDTGNETYNQRLSLMRAKAVYDYLVQRGIPSERLSIRGYGSTKPIDKGTSAAARAANRRIVFRIL